MALLFTILLVIVSVLLVLIVLVQNPKGGGLGSAFGGGSNPQMFGGVKKTTDFLDKATWTLAIAMFVLVLGMNMFTGTQQIEADESQMNEQVDDVAPIVPTTPAQQPAAGGVSDDEMPTPVE